MTARVVYAYRSHHYDSTTPERMHWRCSCGGVDVNIPGDRVRCMVCLEMVTIPNEPIDLTGLPPEPSAGVHQPTSTAWKLAAYREELRACGFAPADIRELVLIAARNTQDVRVGQAFAERAEPAAPFVRIDNHEPGSPQDLAAREQFGLGDGP